MPRTERKQAIRKMVELQKAATETIEAVLAKHGFMPSKLQPTGDYGGFLERSYDLPQGCQLSCVKELTVPKDAEPLSATNTSACISVILSDDGDKIAELTSSSGIDGNTWHYNSEASRTTDSATARRFLKHEARGLKDVAFPGQPSLQEAMKLLEMMCGFAASL